MPGITTGLMHRNPDVVILCGGPGHRLGPLTQKTPKPLLDVGGKPFLLHLLEYLQKEGCRRFVLAARYLADQFVAFARRYRDAFPDMEVSVEPEPLGTGGALRHAASRVRSEDFLALNGDAFVIQPITPLLDFHFQKKSVFTILAVRAENVAGAVSNKGGLKIGNENELLSFNGHERRNEKWVNGGFYVVHREKILSWPEGAYNLEGRLNTLLNPHQALVFRSEASLLDIGTPECFAIARRKYAADSVSSC